MTVKPFKFKCVSYYPKFSIYRVVVESVLQKNAMHVRGWKLSHINIVCLTGLPTFSIKIEYIMVEIRFSAL